MQLRERVKETAPRVARMDGSHDSKGWRRIPCNGLLVKEHSYVYAADEQRNHVQLSLVIAAAERASQPESESTSRLAVNQLLSHPCCPLSRLPSIPTLNYFHTAPFETYRHSIIECQLSPYRVSIVHTECPYRHSIISLAPPAAERGSERGVAGCLN